MTREDIAEIHPDVLLADGFDEAIIGISDTRLSEIPIAIYDISEIIRILMDDDMTQEDALEYYYYNIVGAYVGEQTPIFVQTNLGCY
jgi:hypothetical protein